MDILSLSQSRVSWQPLRWAVLSLVILCVLGFTSLAVDAQDTLDFLVRLFGFGRRDSLRRFLEQGRHHGGRPRAGPWQSLV